MTEVCRVFNIFRQNHILLYKLISKIKINFDQIPDEVIPDTLVTLVEFGITASKIVLKHDDQSIESKIKILWA